jgi:hypothetical protein
MSEERRMDRSFPTRRAGAGRAATGAERIDFVEI